MISLDKIILVLLAGVGALGVLYTKALDTFCLLAIIGIPAYSVGAGLRHLVGS